VSGPRITAHAPVLLCRSVPASVAYWTDKVGFEATGTWGEPPEFAILRRGEARLMLGQAKADHAIVPFWQLRSGLWNAYFWVDDVAAIFEEMKRRGAVIDYDLCRQDYGVLEFGIRDLDEQDIGFGQVL
jgi:catechol 2,3-dioxygenase-like lactoylglutathione lyase family enzyme